MEQEPIDTYNYGDFTEANYRRLLTLARSKYRFSTYENLPGEPHVLWRHDIDFSVQRALALARIENELGVQATYFFDLHCDFYNLFERAIYDAARSIMALGHEIGLHFDAEFYSSGQALEMKLDFEKRVLGELFDRPIKVFSWHNPQGVPEDLLARDSIAGMVNVYGPFWRNNYKYCSDSNGYWRHERLENILKTEPKNNLHILTHPGWWTPEPLSPFERVKRCITGRSAAVLKEYSRSLRSLQRPNVGAEQ